MWVEVFNVGGRALLDRPRMVVQRMCVLCLCSQCASRCSFHRFMFYMTEVMSSIKEFESWITGACSPYVVSLCDLAYYVVG